jgi:hypothetical protein
MATTQKDIEGWLKEAKKEGATHVIIVCDTFDHEDYPVSVMPNEDVKEVMKQYDNKDMQRLMEVYSLRKPLKPQLQKFRAFELD